MSFIYTSTGGGSLTYKDAVRAASLANVPLSGATPLIIDGVTLANNDRVLLKDQGTASQNGIYSVTISGGSYTLSRASDANTSKEMPTGVVIPVSEGTLNKDKNFQLTTNSPITLDVTTLTFVDLLINKADRDLNNLTNPTAINQSLLFNADGTLDVGAPAASRPNRVYAKTAVNVNDIVLSRGALGYSTNLALGINALTGLTGDGVNNAIGHIAIGQDAARYMTTSYASTAIGYQAMMGQSSVPVTGFFNLAFGAQAAQYLSTGTSNLAMGLQALQGQVSVPYSGSSTIAIGNESGKFLSTGGNSVYIGHFAGRGASSTPITGSFNVGIGSSAMTNVSGIANTNTAIGHESMRGHDTTLFSGADNVSVGPFAIREIASTANNNIALGRSALRGNPTGTPGLSGAFNIGIGRVAGQYITTGSNNTAIGQSALQGSFSSGLTGTQNIGIGTNTGTALTSGSSNILIGNTAGNTLTTGSNNVLIAGNASSATASNEINIADKFRFQPASGLGKILIGDFAGLDNVGTGCIGIGNWTLRGPNGTNGATGADNTAVGSFAMGEAGLTTGESNTAVGTRALLYITTGNNNTAVGTVSLQAITTGQSNVGIGYAAGNKITTGFANVALGFNTMAFGTGVTGQENVAIAASSLFALTAGSFNVAIGSSAGSAISTGFSNILLGQNAGNSITTGNNNIMIGSGALPSSATASGEINIGDAIKGTTAEVKISNRDLSIETVGKGLKIKTGTDATAGLATILNGNSEVTVTTAACTASSIILVTNQTSTAYVSVTTKGAGSFKIAHANNVGADQECAWFIINPA